MAVNIPAKPKYEAQIGDAQVVPKPEVTFGEPTVSGREVSMGPAEVVQPPAEELDFRGDPISPQEIARRALIKQQDRPVEPSPVQLDDMFGAVGPVGHLGEMAAKRMAKSILAKGGEVSAKAMADELPLLARNLLERAKTTPLKHVLPEPWEYGGAYDSRAIQQQLKKLEGTPAPARIRGFGDSAIDMSSSANMAPPQVPAEQQFQKMVQDWATQILPKATK